MNLIKIFSAVALAGVAAGMIIKNDLDEKKKNKELDEFLLLDETEPVVVNVPEDSGMDKDIMGIDKCPTMVSFTCADKDKCLLFQDLLSEKGLSSDLTSENLNVTVVYNEEVNEENLSEFLSDLKDVLGKVEAKYEGCR